MGRSAYSKCKILTKLYDWSVKVEDLSAKERIKEIQEAKLGDLKKTLADFFNGEPTSLSPFLNEKENLDKCTDIEQRLLKCSSMLLKMLGHEQGSSFRETAAVFSQLQGLAKENGAPLSPNVLSASLWRAFREVALLLEQMQLDTFLVERETAGAKDESNADAKGVDKKFRDVYVSTFTDAHADELDALRKDENFDGADVSVIIDLMESGADMFTTIEKELVLKNLEKIPTPTERPLHRSKSGPQLQMQAVDHAHNALMKGQ